MSDHQSDAKTSDIYCAENHAGPLCKVRMNKSEYYFDNSMQRCKKCRPMYNLVAQASVVLFIVVVIFVCMWRFLRRLSTPLSLIVVSLDLQAKLKVVVELNHSFQEVYGVKIDDRMKRWFAFVKFFSLDFLPTLSIPRDCLRSKKNGYIYNVYWQYILSCILINSLHR